jgi:hypothetical protein
MTEKVVTLEDHRDDPYAVAHLYFYLQDYKKKLRLQFLQDIEKMKTEGADTDALVARLRKHERSVRTMRFAFDEVAGNDKPNFNSLVEDCDRYGINEFKQRLLYVREIDKRHGRS